MIHSQALLTGPCRGCDIQVAADGNFMQRHNADSGDCPPFPYSPIFVVPTPFITDVGGDLDDTRKGPPREYSGEVPVAVLQHCEDSHTAADGTRVKAAGDHHDDKGLMALICRHDIPLFVCNIDSPGEQQKYFFGLLIWLSLHLPDNATIAGFYDVACVSARIAAMVRLSQAQEPDRTSRVRHSTISSRRVFRSVLFLSRPPCMRTRTSGHVRSSTAPG